MEANEFESLMFKMVSDKKITLYNIVHYKRTGITHLSFTFERDQSSIGEMYNLNWRGYLAVPKARDREAKFFKSSDAAIAFLLEGFPYPIKVSSRSFDV